MTVKIIIGDCRERLKELANESVHCVVCSPPYWGLRDYQTAKWEGGDPACDHVIGDYAATGRGMAALSEKYRGGGHKASEPKPMTAKRECPHCGARRIDAQIGLESTYQEYVEQMVEVFREVRRVLRADGTLWLNLGDTYAVGGGGPKPGHIGGDCNKVPVSPSRRAALGLKPKDLCGIPWRVAFALQADGWYLRQDVIWSKSNPMPESVTDRCTKAHEYLFLLTKSARYYYDAEAIKEPQSEGTFERFGNGKAPRQLNAKAKLARQGEHLANSDFKAATPDAVSPDGMRNKRSVWEVASAPFSEAHFATFPPALIEPCILAGTSAKGCCAKCWAPWVRKTKSEFVPQQDVSLERGIMGANGQKSMGHRRDGGSQRGTRSYETIGWSPSCACDAGVVPATILDPFAGAGTTGLVADRLQRDAILIELNASYMRMAQNRISDDAGLFAQIETDRS